MGVREEPEGRAEMASVRGVLYAITDTLGLQFEHDTKTDRIRGEGTNTVNFGPLPVNFHSRIVSSQVLDKDVLLMLRVKGNLSLLIEGRGERMGEMIIVHLLNLAKMDKIEGWLEAARCKSVEDCITQLGDAIVKSFRKVSKTEWEQL